jgi:hypothetical protein
MCSLTVKCVLFQAALAEEREGEEGDAVLQGLDTNERYLPYRMCSLAIECVLVL